MNEQNLIPFPRRTESEQREIRSKGGKKSGEVRRKKRDMKSCMELLLSLPATKESDYELLSELGAAFGGLSEDDITNMLVINAALVKLAKAGDVTAIRELRSIIRDNDLEKQKIKSERKKPSLKGKNSNTKRSATVLPKKRRKRFALLTIYEYKAQ